MSQSVAFFDSYFAVIFGCLYGKNSLARPLWFRRVLWHLTLNSQRIFCTLKISKLRFHLSRSVSGPLECLSFARSAQSDMAYARLLRHTYVLTTSVCIDILVVGFDNIFLQFLSPSRLLYLLMPLTVEVHQNVDGDKSATCGYYRY